MLKEVVYDIEVLKNVFTFTGLDYTSGIIQTFEVSERKNEYSKLLDYIQGWARRGYVMTGFNNYGYDYPVIHSLFKMFPANRAWNDIVDSAYEKSNEIISSTKDEKFAHCIRNDDMIMPQLDLYRINGFDRPETSCGLKRIEFNMRRKSIVEFEFDFSEGVPVHQITNLIRYNCEDVIATSQFRNHCSDIVNMRYGLRDKLGDAVLYYSNQRIAEEFIKSKLIELDGKKAVYSWDKENNIWKKKGSPRSRIVVDDIIFKGIYNFKTEEGKRLLADLRSSYIHIDKEGGTIWSSSPDIERSKELYNIAKKDYAQKLEAKNKYYQLYKEQGGARYASEEVKYFKVIAEEELKKSREVYRENAKIIEGKSLHINLCGAEFDYGRGGIHGSLSNVIIRSTSDMVIIDRDMKSFYPSLIVEYNLRPEHLPDTFNKLYSQIRDDRLKFKEEGNSLAGPYKIILNATYGKTLNKYSLLYDPKCGSTITFNGQILLLLLWEMLAEEVKGIEFIQGNTDGITYRMPRNQADKEEEVYKKWSKLSKMVPEKTIYRAMAIRDVSSYIAVKEDGSLKLKGAYNYSELFDGSKSSGIVWYRNHSAPIIKKAAVRYLIYNKGIDETLEREQNIFEFCYSIHTTQNVKGYIGDTLLQKSNRVVVVKDGGESIKFVYPGLKHTPEKERTISKLKGRQCLLLNTVDTERRIDTYKLDYGDYWKESDKLVNNFKEFD